MTELFEPLAHETLTDTAWDAERARAAIRAIVAETEAAFDNDALWAPHPLDEEEGEPPLGRVSCVYLGASGVIWALHSLQRSGVADGRDWSEVAVRLPELYRAEPDFPNDGVEPSLSFGEAGILLVAHTLAPARWQEEQLLDAVRGNVANPTLELMWGAPGTMLAAQVLHERTGAAEWVDAWQVSADNVWAAWDGELWCQSIYGNLMHVLGPAHGFVGNVYALDRGDLLDQARRDELERRAVDVISTHAQRADGCAQWPPAIDPPRPGVAPQPIRTQWCHGAPGIVASLATLAPGDDRLSELLVEGGELTWRAGPLVKGANLCHGTAGNGYAFLKLFERTGDELWLQRARAFAMHAIEQVERSTAEHRRGRHSLWSGDLGTALYAESCIAANAAFPTLDVF